MYSYYPMTYASRPVHVIKAQADSSHDIQISVMAERFDAADPLKLASDFRDSYLESNGYTRIGVINGGIFDAADGFWFANGVEKAFWNAHEPNDDIPLDNVMAFGHSGDVNNYPIFDIQDNIQANLNSYRGALTGAFGLIKNGVVYKGAWVQGVPTKKSGRSIIGKDSSGVIYFIASPGVSPTVSNPDGIGLSGQNCIDLCLSLGLSDAIALDGGGSVSLIYEDNWKVSTSRQVKNAIGLYVKQKSPNPDPDPTPGTGLTYARNMYVPMFAHKWPHKIMSNGQLVPVIDIKVKRNGVLVSLNELQKGGN